ncbi:auxin response factor [Vigna unguiculata]|uniref:Auxin response factor n=1 Tax=Vigna unguiculata TaxID=3917 RepID=A0A4D6MU21_VIGUN|nr:auxin response factor [Vigna unguiculata]
MYFEPTKHTKHSSTPNRRIHPYNHGSVRSCTKVDKKGIALGRSVDFTKFSAYDELVAESDELFEFEGELTSP